MRKKESKIFTKDIQWECKCRFDGENAIQINDGIKENVEANVKNATYMKNIIFGILLHVVVKMENI